MEQKAFYKLSYGLYVISSKRGAHYNGQTANTVFQISSEPPTLAIGINKNNLTHEFINESKVFAVSILPLSAPLNLIGHFGFKSGRVMDKFAEIPYKTGMLGIPILSDYSIGFFEAEVINQLDVGTHTVFIGRVVNSEVYRDEEPMTYAHYHLLKKGTVPPIVPEQVKERPEVKTGIQEVSGTKQNKMKEEKIMKQYACSVCGYIYDPETGDPDAGIAPGTPFENLPDDWACPVCGVGKDQFEVVE